MLNRMLWGFCSLLGSFVLLSSISQAQGLAKRETSSQLYTHEYTLSNGLRLIVREDHRSPTVAHMVWYRAGSIDEHNGTTGVAHVLEHMMFKGTEKVGVGEFSKRVAALGGRENAFTSQDYTAYFQQIEKSHLNAVMDLEADRMQNLNLSEDEFKKEIQVIMEERRLRTEDQASSLLYEQLLATAFNASPVRHPVIGWMADLKTMTYKDARDWYDHWYSPNNAVVVIAGDVDPAAVYQLAEKNYGRVPVRKILERKSQEEPIQKGIRRFHLKAPAENPLIYFAWKVPHLLPHDLTQVDPYALDILSGILDGNANARLNRILVREKRLANQVGASYDACCSRSETMFLIHAEPMPGKSADMMELEIKKILNEIALNGVREDELKRIKIAITATQVYKRDSVFGQAMEIGATEMAGMSWRNTDEFIDRLQSVTSEQIQAVVKKYFIDDHLTVGILDPQALDPKTQAANARAAAALKH